MRDVAKYLAALGVPYVSPPAARCAELLERWFGLHHFEGQSLRRADWANRHCVEIGIRHTIDTFDFDLMTRLVFLAHDLAIRVEVEGRRGPHRALTLIMHPRRRDGAWHERHPTLDEALERWREKEDRRIVAQADLDAPAEEKAT